MTKKERAFRGKVKKLIERADSLKDTEVRRAVKLLSDARKEVAAAVASTEWQAYHLPQLKAAIERALQNFGDRYGVQLREAQREFWEEGLHMVDLPMRTVGIVVAVPEIDVTMLSIMQGFSADLVEGLTKSAIEKINTELTLGLMGQKSPYDVMGAIGRNLKDKSIFKSIADRAEAITRTEAGRVLSAASHARLEGAAGVVPGLMKEWRHSHVAKVPRLAHLAIEGQRVPVDEPFVVAGEELMYPRDPAGSARNTIRCE